MSPELEKQMREKGIVPIMACPPLDKLEQLRIGIRVFKPCAGGVEGICRECRQAIWIGPEQQDAVLKFPDAVALCFKCAVMAGGGAPANIQSCGGTGSYYGSQGV